ncbi:ornithine decarboxylase antizyme 1-like [Diadema antillarum]|uniref:ornithine decarboxylase antizyme 1-like n=1 Tax=Diadema antillarum TaxID=105358 RepID=UPI003A8C52DC
MRKKRRKVATYLVQSTPSTNASTRCPLTEQPCWSPERTTSSRLEGRLSSAPDVPSGSEDGLILQSVTEEDEKSGILASKFFKNLSTAGGPSDTSYLRFLHHLTDNLLVKWESVLHNSRLYVQLPTDSLHQGSRDSLVELLDIAEEQLECKQVIIMFSRNRQDVAALMRTFKFMGFETMPPGHELLPQSSDHFFMAYNI